jgi:hypothetical protein
MTSEATCVKNAYVGVISKFYIGLRLDAVLLFSRPPNCCEKRFEMCKSSQCNISGKCVISGFRHEVDESRTPPGYYAARSGNFFPTYHVSLFVLSGL